MLTAQLPISPAMRCETCGREAECSPVDLRVFSSIGTPKCCGVPMLLPVTKPPTERQSIREGHRRARPGIRVSMYRADVKGGPNLGAGLENLGAEGACVRLTAQVFVDDVLDIEFFLANEKSIKVRSKVRWCRPIGGALFAAGVEFDRRLTLSELANLVR